MVDDIETCIFSLARRYNGVYLFNNEKKQRLITPDTDFDTDMHLDVSEAEDLMGKFSGTYQIDKGDFKIEIIILMSLSHGIHSKKPNLYLFLILLSAC